MPNFFSRENTQKLDIGQLGEDIAARYLSRKGYAVVERNYREKWGEIDIIAKKQGVYRFIEVKAVERDVLRETTQGQYNPLEKVHGKKLARLHRTIVSYLAKKGIENVWQLDVVAVEIALKDKKAKCLLIENV